MIDLVRAGRTPSELAEQYEPSRETIRLWVKQAELDEGERRDGLTSTEKAELARLRVYDAAPDARPRRCLAVHPFPLKEAVLPLQAHFRRQTTRKEQPFCWRAPAAFIARFSTMF